jgi:hypothetical protein
MIFNEIVKMVEGEWVHDAGNGGQELRIGCSSDLMSDILTLDLSEHAVLVTGLANVQAVRTASMADIHHVIIVRNKPLADEMVRLAADLNISLVSTPRTMFTVCGLLYKSGLKTAY